MSAVPEKMLASVVAALATVSGLVVPAAVVPAAAGVPAQCAQVWFIGARGSGQSGTVDPKQGQYGMGPEVDHMYSVVDTDLKARGLTTAPMAVHYAADSVDVLKPDAAVVWLLKHDAVAAATVEWVHSSVDKYDASMDDGIKQAEGDVAAVLSACPDAQVVLAGYSQGAVVMHDAENYLAKNKPHEFAHIAGTLLLGDPDRVPHTKAKTFGTEPAGGEGLRVYLCLVKLLHICLVKPHDVPAPATTAEIANSGDIVADFTLGDLTSSATRKHGSSVHTSYLQKDQKLLAAAADWVAAKVLPNTDDGWQITTLSLPAGLGGCSGFGVGGCQPTVACVTATACAGSVTFVGADGISHARLLWGSGSSWELRPVPLPADGDPSQPAMLRGVSCTTVAGCVATGSYTTTGNAGASMLLSGHASSWKSIAAPVPAGGQLFGSGVGTLPACGSNGCMAAGPGLLEWFNGSSWTPVQAPVPAGNPAVTEEVLYSAACSGATTCASSGLYGPSTSQEVMVSGHGNAWVASHVVLPAGSEVSSQPPDNVGCEPSGHCVAVLPYVNVLGQARSLVVWGYGSSWSAVKYLPVPADGIAGSAIPFSAACASSDCLLSGEYTRESGAVGGLLLWGSGSTWTASKEPMPAGATELEGGSAISCSSAKLCVAAGNYVNAVGNPQGMLVWGSASSWHVTAAPSGILMYGDGCALNSACAAVGSDTSPDLKLFWGPG